MEKHSIRARLSWYVLDQARRDGSTPLAVVCSVHILFETMPPVQFVMVEYIQHNS